jgi:hypothetical protein
VSRLPVFTDGLLFCYCGVTVAAGATVTSGSVRERTSLVSKPVRLGVETGRMVPGESENCLVYRLNQWCVLRDRSEWCCSGNSPGPVILRTGFKEKGMETGVLYKHLLLGSRTRRRCFP